MNPTRVTRTNLQHIDFSSIVVFYYTEPGGMGNSGTVDFSTADGKFYRLNYLQDLSMDDFRRAYRAGSFETQPIPPFTWKYIYLGDGNHFLIHQKVYPLLKPRGEISPGQVCTNWRNSLGKPILSKEERYHWLIEKARASYPPQGSGAELTWCDGCEDEINLWTYWQGRGNLDPKILLVGLDWGNPYPESGKRYLPIDQIKAGPPYDDSKMFPTDKNLMKLFWETFGVKLNEKRDDLFFSNMVLGYRTGRSSGELKTPITLDKAFFKELVNILQPQAVICLGEKTFEAALDAYGRPLPYSGKFNAALDMGETTADIDGIRFFGMAHCGVQGCRNRARVQKSASIDAGLEKQIQDWKRIGNYICL